MVFGNKLYFLSNSTIAPEGLNRAIGRLSKGALSSYPKIILLVKILCNCAILCGGAPSWYQIRLLYCWIRMFSSRFSHFIVHVRVLSKLISSITLLAKRPHQTWRLLRVSILTASIYEVSSCQIMLISAIIHSRCGDSRFNSKYNGVENILIFSNVLMGVG